MLNRPAAFKSRTKPETDVFGQNRRPDTADLDQLFQSRPFRSCNFKRATLNQNAVLTFQRNDVGHRSKRDQIQLRFQIERIEWPRLEQRMTQFEDDADAAEIMKRRTWIDFRIHDRNAIRQRRFRLVMIEHNHVYAASLEIDNLIYRRSPAIDRDQKLRAEASRNTDQYFRGSGRSLPPSATAEIIPVPRHRISAQHFRQQRERGHSIDIVIAEEHDPLMSIQRRENSRDRRLHVRQQKRIAQQFEPRSQKFFNFFRARKTFPQQ